MTTNLFNNTSYSNYGGGTTTGSDGSVLPATGISNSASSDMFTKLLVAQIKNQDPLAPTDPAQFVNQLTQLSQTEALQSLASMTSASASSLQSMQVLALGAQIGSDVVASTSSVTLDGAKLDGRFTLAGASSATTLVLTGSDGVAHNKALGTLAAGEQAFAIDPAALGLAPGTYQIKVTTSTSETPTLNIAGKLNSVRLSASGAVLLNVAHLGEVASGAVTGFNGKTGASAATSTL